MRRKKKWIEEHMEEYNQRMRIYMRKRLGLIDPKVFTAQELLDMLPSKFTA